MKTSVISTKEEQVPTTAITSPITSTTGNPPGQSNLPDGAPGGGNPKVDIGIFPRSCFGGGWIFLAHTDESNCEFDKKEEYQCWAGGTFDPVFWERMQACLPGSKFIVESPKIDPTNRPPRSKEGKYDIAVLNITDFWKDGDRAELDQMIGLGLLKETSVVGVICPFGVGFSKGQSLDDFEESGCIACIMGETQKIEKLSGWPKVIFNTVAERGYNIEAVGVYQGYIPHEVCCEPIFMHVYLVQE